MNDVDGTTLIAFVHTAPSNVSVFGAWAVQLLSADTRVMNIVDDRLLAQAREDGAVSTMTKRRLAGHVWSAADAGADVVLVTCSSMGRAVEQVRPFCAVPVLRVDEPMAEQAVAIGSRVGVLATLATTLEPTSDLVRAAAARAGRPVQVTDLVCPGAFDAVSEGDVETHDALVVQGLERLAAEVDVVLLAQASMARAVERIDGAAIGVPVLSSPRSAVERLAEVVAERRRGH